MKKDRYESYIAVPALVPPRVAFGVLKIFKWLLALTCAAVVLFILWQIVTVLDDVSHHRTPAALRRPHTRTTVPKRSE